MLSPTRAPQADDVILDHLFKVSSRIEALEFNQKKMDSHSKRLEEILETLSQHWAKVGRDHLSAPAEKASSKDEFVSFSQKVKNALENRLSSTTNVADASPCEPPEERLQQVEKTRLGSTDQFVKSCASETLEERLTRLEEANRDSTIALVNKSAFDALGERLTKVEMAFSSTLQVHPSSNVELVLRPEFEGLAERLMKVEKALSDGNQLTTLPQLEKQGQGQPALSEVSKPTFLDTSHFEPVTRAVHGHQDTSASCISDSAGYHVEAGVTSARACEWSDFISHVDSHVEYTVQESAWDIMLLCSLRILRLSDFVAVFCTFIANATLQVLAVCLICAAFTKPAFDGLEVWKRWRYVDAHDYAFYSRYSGTSLATRVCHRDSSLSIATAQVNALLLFDDYHQGSIGLLTCIGCIMIFFVTMAHEVRKGVSFAFACFGLHSPGAETRLEYDSENNCIVIKSLSTCRVIVACFVSLLRIGIAIALLVAGSLWLARTPGIVDLVLNVVAVSFVLELDESLFLVFLPGSVQAVCRRLDPISVPSTTLRRCPNGIGVLLAASLCTYSISFLITEVIPMSDTMREIEHELCNRGNTNFVVFEQSKSLVPYILTTDDKYDKSRENNNAISFAVKEILSNTEADRNWDVTLSTFGESYSDPAFIAFEASLSIEEINTIYNVFCYDNPYDYWPAAFENVALQTGIHPDLSSLGDTACGAFVSKCDEPKAVLLRGLCPVTCKCDDARGGLYFAGSKFGCPDCSFNDKDYNASCTDPSPQELLELPGWLRYWEGFQVHVRVTGFFDEVNVSLVAEKGCAVVTDFTIYELCEGSFVNIVSSSLASFCPQLCGCASATGKMVRWCPPSCAADGGVDGDVHGDGDGDGDYYASHFGDGDG